MSLVQVPIFTQSTQKPLNLLRGWSRRNGNARLPRNAIAILLQPLSLQMVSNCIIQELIGPLIATVQCTFVDLDVVVDVLALLN